ncbi:MAG: hypothetical protein V4719_07130 [Planctomycetota bacterium]
MIPFRPLNGMQKMMLRWEEFRALNAAHVVELGHATSIQDAETAVHEACRTVGLNPVEFCSQRKNFRFLDQPVSTSEEFPSLEHRHFAASGVDSIHQVLQEQLNRPFETGAHWPFRFLFVEAPDSGPYLVVVYQHVVSDSRGVQLILREVLRALFRQPSKCGKLRYHPPALQELFADEYGWKNLPRRAYEVFDDIYQSSGCFRAREHDTGEQGISCGIQATGLPISLIKMMSRQSGVTVQDLLFASMLEAYALLFQDQLQNTRRKTLAVYTPVDLRRESPENVDDAMGQMLGCMTVRLKITPGMPFPEIISRVAEQTRAVKRTHGYRTHAAHLDTMSKLWDRAPKWMNRTVGPNLFPLLGVISNCNLSDFFAEELSTGRIRNYFRVSGTGLIVPMMLTVTTLGPSVNLTTTYHENTFNQLDMQRVGSHIKYRITGQLHDIASHDEFMNLNPNQTDFNTDRSTYEPRSA